MPVKLRLPRRPGRPETLIAVAGLLGGLVLWFLGLRNNPPLFGLPQEPALLALLAMSVAELLRRTAPMAGLAIGTGALLLAIGTGQLVVTILMYTDVLYAAVLYGSAAAARRIARACEVLTVAATLLALALTHQPGGLLIGFAVGIVFIAPAWTGIGVRTHRDAAEAARLAAERTALLAELDRREAVAAERTRMAREFHDMIAGHLSAIAIHSAAALSIDEPWTSREALGVIRENSVQGLAEMRRLIGVLRHTGDGEPTASPTLDSLDVLLDHARTAVRDERFSFTLRDHRGPAPLPAPVELAAYRIVQESLTNAVKHAAPGEVTVALSRDGDGGGPLTVRVTSPLGPLPDSRAPGARAGLTGMRERVALVGGALITGPAPGAGHWEVRAELPVDHEEKP